MKAIRFAHFIVSSLSFSMLFGGYYGQLGSWEPLQHRLRLGLINSFRGLRRVSLKD